MGRLEVNSNTYAYIISQVTKTGECGAARSRALDTRTALVGLDPLECLAQVLPLPCFLDQPLTSSRALACTLRPERFGSCLSALPGYTPSPRTKSS